MPALRKEHPPFLTSGIAHSSFAAGAPRTGRGTMCRIHTRPGCAGQCRASHHMPADNVLDGGVQLDFCPVEHPCMLLCAAEHSRGCLRTHRPVRHPALGRKVKGRRPVHSRIDHRLYRHSALGYHLYRHWRAECMRGFRLMTGILRNFFAAASCMPWQTCHQGIHISVTPGGEH